MLAVLMLFMCVIIEDPASLLPPPPLGRQVRKN